MFVYVSENCSFKNILNNKYSLELGDNTFCVNILINTKADIRLNDAVLRKNPRVNAVSV